MSVNNNQPNQNPNNNNPDNHGNPLNPGQGFTMQQKFILLSLTLVMVTVATVFLAVLQFYQPQSEPMVIVVTATPEQLSLPAEDLSQGQVSDSSGGEPTFTPTPTITSVSDEYEDATWEAMRTPENGTAFAISVNATIEAMGGMDAVGGYAGWYTIDRQTRRAERGVYETPYVPPVLTPFQEVRPTMVFADLPECLKPYFTPEADVVNGVGHFHLDPNSQEVKKIIQDFYSHISREVGEPAPPFECPK